MKVIDVVNAEYVEEYKVKIFFNDDTFQIVDFGPFLFKHPHECWDNYRKIANFKKFKIDHGNLVWGRDWDLIFPVLKLYKGKVS